MNCCFPAELMQYTFSSFAGWEHDTIAAVLGDNSPIAIAMEVHSVVLLGDLKSGVNKRLKNAADMHLFFNRMYEAGYHVLDIRDNLTCLKCLEVLFMRSETQPGCGATKNKVTSAVSSLSRYQIMTELEQMRKENRKDTKSTFCNAKFLNASMTCP
jgi:hypothetical protein